MIPHYWSPSCSEILNHKLDLPISLSKRPLVGDISSLSFSFGWFWVVTSVLDVLDGSVMAVSVTINENLTDASNQNRWKALLLGEISLLWGGIKHTKSGTRPLNKNYRKIYLLNEVLWIHTSQRATKLPCVKVWDLKEKSKILGMRLILLNKCTCDIRRFFLTSNLTSSSCL